MRRLLFYVLLAIGICAPLAASQAKEALPQVALELVAEGLGAPLLLVAPPDGSGRRLIGDQLGVVYVLDRDGRRLATPFIDLRDQLTPLLQAFDERGLLALAFHPGFVKNGLLYINYSARRRPQSPFNGKTAYTWRTSEFKVSAADANQVDRSTERVLLQLDWVNRKHNGGGLAFGPDGYLYIGVGDGGGAHGVPDIYIPPKTDEKDPARHAKEIQEDPFKIPGRFHKYDAYAQDTGRLNGKILRIDVDRGHP
ncbi:MAG: PQQ-dependent sugar dehydrogenase, partial [Alphaproteobacteria bacterium]|nr:PQQ-dependent sugar dehydrogenase [Alphaproteobacteria bacterium]